MMFAAWFSQWGSTMKSPWVCTVINQCPFWYDLRCLQGHNTPTTNQPPASSWRPGELLLSISSLSKYSHCSAHVVSGSVQWVAATPQWVLWLAIGSLPTNRTALNNGTASPQVEDAPEALYVKMVRIGYSFPRTVTCIPIANMPFFFAGMSLSDLPQQCEPLGTYFDLFCCVLHQLLHIAQDRFVVPL